MDTAAWADALQVEAALAASTGREQCGHVASVPLPIDATLLHEHQHIYQRPGVGSPCHRKPSTFCARGRSQLPRVSISEHYYSVSRQGAAADGGV